MPPIKKIKPAASTGKGNNQDTRPFAKSEYGDLYLAVTPSIHRRKVTTTIKDEGAEEPESPSTGRTSHKAGKKRKRTDTSAKHEVEDILSPEPEAEQNPK